MRDTCAAPPRCRWVVLHLVMTGVVFNRPVLLALIIPADKDPFGWGVAFCIHACVARVLQQRIGQQVELCAGAGVHAAGLSAPV